MKKVLIASLAAVAGLGCALTIVAARFEPTILPNTYVGPVNVGGMVKEDAARRVRIWWEGVRVAKLKPVHNLLLKPLPEMTPGQLGVTVDDEASIAALPMSDLVQAVGEKVGAGDAQPQKFPVRFKPNGTSLAPLNKLIKDSIGKARPPQVLFEKGTIIRKPEVTTFQLDQDALATAVEEAVKAQSTEVQVPLKEAPKRIPDEELNKIKEVVSEYSTHFPSYQTSRNANIRLASAKLNGIVLLPGDKVAFNATVGRRTVEGGYKEAPVLVNGKHDTGIGGGICQVSTTLYNASLLADLAIVKRQNHSIPSVYVPVGRDATVDWPSLDLVIQNNRDFPIAISSTYQSGKITFRVLGIKDPTMKVKIITANHRVWDRGQKVTIDRSLKPGKRVVVDRGSRAHAIDVYRIVYKNGVEVRRDTLSHSIYGGSPTTIAYNPAAPAAPSASPAATPSTPIGQQ